MHTLRGTTCLLLLALVMLPAVSTGHSIPTTGRFQLVGFTTTTHLGNTGVLGFTAACQAEFPESRMCSSQEILSTTVLPSSLSGKAWVQPTILPGDVNNVIDASGVRSNVFGISCDGWSTIGFTGLTVDGGGSFNSSLAACVIPRSVSCCAVVPDLSEGDVNGDGFVNVVDVVVIRRFLAGLPVNI